MAKRIFVGVAVTGAAVLLTSCAASPRTVEGECQDLFGSEVCTWGIVTDGEVVEFGATVPMASIDGAPADAAMQLPPGLAATVRLPVEVREATGFDHLGINWEAQGHPPTPFMEPHFDFHFYAMTPEEMAAVDCLSEETPAALPDEPALPDLEIPGLGTPAGSCVPMMGMHSMPTAEADATEPSGTSMIVGYRDQTVIAIETMIARAKLKEGRSFAMSVPSVRDTRTVTRWPTGFEAVYDEATQSYRLVFTTGTQ